LFLTWQASANGVAAIDKWHDSAGLSIFFMSFACLWVIAMWMKRKSDMSLSATAENKSRKQKVEMGNPAAEPSAPTASQFQLSTFPISALKSRRFLLVLGAWSLLCLLATEVWYRSHETKDKSAFHWSVTLPEANPSFERIELPPRSRNLLGCVLGVTGRWMEANAREWTVFFFRWNPNSIQSVIQSRNHRPEVCLPAAGLRQVSESELDLYDAGTLKLPFRSYVYEFGGSRLYVFFCQWEDGAEHQIGLQASKQLGRLQSVLTGRRILGQQTLELILTGYDSLAEAQADVRSRLPALIKPESERALSLEIPSPKASSLQASSL
jgi:hypothetical protein